MSRKWVVVAIGAVALFAAAYFGSPYWAARQLREAAMSGDVDRIERAVDFPAVRESLKAQLSVALTEKMTNDPEMKANPFAGLGVMLMPTIVQRAVDTFVTPDGLAAMIKQGKLKDAKNDQPPPNLTYDYDWRGLDRFAVAIRANEVPAERAPMLILERRGLFSWKLIRLQVPTDMMTSG